MTTAKTVHQALAAVMAELPNIGKGDKSPEGYSYRGIEAVTKHLQPLLAKHGVVIVPEAHIVATVPSPAMKDGWQDVIMHVDWTIVGPDGSTLKASTNGVGRDRSDKGANKAQTQAFKYLVLHLFCIADGKDDSDGHTYEQDRRPEGQPSERRYVATDETKAKRSKIVKLRDELSPPALARLIKFAQDKGLPDPDRLTSKQADQVLAWLDKQPEAAWLPKSDSGGATDREAVDTPHTEPAEAGRADMDTPPEPSPEGTLV